MGVSEAFDEVMAEMEKDEQTATETAAPPESPPVEPTAPSPDTAPATPPVEPAQPDKAEPSAGDIKIDAMGRMHRPDGTVMSKAEQSAEEARRAAQAPADTPATPPAPEAPAATTPAPRPYKSNVYGEEKEVFPGALIADGHGVFIPEAQRGRFDQLTARGLQYDVLRDEVRTVKQQIAASQERFSAVTGAINTTLGQHFASPETLEALAEAVLTQGAQTVFDRTSLAIERASLEIDRKFGAAGTAPVTQPEASRGDESGHSIPPLDINDMHEAFQDYMADVFKEPAFHGMPAEMKADLVDALKECGLFRYDREMGHVIDESKADKTLSLARRAMAQLRTTASATAFNAKQTTASATPAPPSVVTAKAPVGSGKVSTTKKPTEQTGDPWEDAMAESSRLIRAG